MTETAKYFIVLMAEKFPQSQTFYPIFPPCPLPLLTSPFNPKRGLLSGVNLKKSSSLYVLYDCAIAGC